MQFANRVANLEASESSLPFDSIQPPTRYSRGRHSSACRVHVLPQRSAPQQNRLEIRSDQVVVRENIQVDLIPTRLSLKHKRGSIDQLNSIQASHSPHNAIVSESRPVTVPKINRSTTCRVNRRRATGRSRTGSG